MTADLVMRAQRGDHAAFEALARASADRLVSIARRVLSDPFAAEDAVQECLIRAWRDLRALRDPHRFDAWLYRLLLNSCRDEQRRSKRRVTTVEITMDSATPVDDVAAVDHRDQLARGFATLTLEHRMALTLHHFLGLRPVEIGEVLGVPTGTVSSRLHYAGRALRAALEGNEASLVARGNER
jgi:RNA polymerase sigma-70 factor, ECF subfamily